MSTTLSEQQDRVDFDKSELDGSIVDRFARVVSECAERTAVVGADSELSYRELDRRTNQLAHAILERTRPGIGCVAFLVEHSPDMIVCVLGILKAAKTYLCVHPAMPPSAQADVIADAIPDLLIVGPRHRDKIGDIAAAGNVPILYLEDVDADAPDSAPGVTVDPQDGAVIFYTSGSTGRPKGVLKSHRMLLHRTWLAVQYEQISIDDRCSLMASCSFASSEADVFATLLNGATLALYDVATRGLTRFGVWIVRLVITLLHPPVVLFRRYLATR